MNRSEFFPYHYKILTGIYVITIFQFTNYTSNTFTMDQRRFDGK